MHVLSFFLYLAVLFVETNSMADTQKPIALERFIIDASAFIWNVPILALLLGGGIFFMFYARFSPFRYFWHGVAILRGKYDNPDDPGEISHFQALSAALAATVGMGNISGVAVAITTGGPGALFWMWVSAFIGMATKFFTCTLAVMYRGRDTQGQPEGGPMYVITEGLGQQWRPLAVFFAIAGLFGATPMFQANQFTQVLRDMVLIPQGLSNAESHFYSDLLTGLALVILVSGVIFGGIKVIARQAERLVPMMVLLYVLTVVYILITHWAQVPACFALIFHDAFTGQAVLGGAVGEVIRTGVRRAAFSNEAGIGTAPMMHGAAKTSEPVREGLVAMLGPVIDTLIVCTMTALAILVTGVWQQKGANGISLTAQAFDQAIPDLGSWLLLLCAMVFSITTLFSYSYYGVKCLSFLIGARYKQRYNYFYIATIILGAVGSIEGVLSFIDLMYALMAIPTMVSALILAPKVRQASQVYFDKLRRQELRHR